MSARSSFSGQLEKSRKLQNPSLNKIVLQEVMEDGTGGEGAEGKKQLSEVVKECVSRWFQETRKEAIDGDIKMQVLVTQMYFNGYGVSRDPKKGKYWMKRASKYLSSIEAVSDKRPGYGASDSDSDDPSSES